MLRCRKSAENDHEKVSTSNSSAAIKSAGVSGETLPVAFLNKHLLDQMTNMYVHEPNKEILLETIQAYPSEGNTKDGKTPLNGKYYKVDKGRRQGPRHRMILHCITTLIATFKP
jgi:hypothetical protein